MRFQPLVAAWLTACLICPVPGQAQSATGAAPDAIFRQGAQLEREKETAKAVSLYEQAARQGYTPSMVRLGFLREHGFGVSRDLPEAFALYDQAAVAGDPDGQFQLAMCYANGVGTDRNPQLARKWFLQSAGRGNQQAQFLLGLMLENGEGGEKKEFAARRWLDKAASGPDHEIADRAATIRDKIDKQTLRPDSSGPLLLGIFAAFLVVGAFGNSNPSSSGPSMTDIQTKCSLTAAPLDYDLADHPWVSNYSSCIMRETGN